MSFSDRSCHQRITQGGTGCIQDQRVFAPTALPVPIIVRALSCGAVACTAAALSIGPKKNLHLLLDKLDLTAFNNGTIF